MRVSSLCKAPNQGKIILDLVEEQKRLIRLQENDREFGLLLDR